MTFGSLTVLLTYEIVAFVIMPLVSIAVLINKIRETFKNVKAKEKVMIPLSLQQNYGNYPVKDYSYTSNKTYLIFGRLLN